MHVCVCVCTLCIVCTMFSFPSVHLITYDDGVALPWMWFFFYRSALCSSSNTTKVNCNCFSGSIDLVLLNLAGEILEFAQ